VRLSAQQRAHLEQITRNGTSSAKRLLHARVLLMADEAHPSGCRTDQWISQALGLHVKSVSRIRRSFVTGGISLAVERKQRPDPPVEPKLDGAGEATLVAVCCSDPPQGHARWTLQLLCDELVNRRIVASICLETVRKTLKKTNCSLGV
jgi:hypothetical protein